jgi:hypothetical protein
VQLALIHVENRQLLPALTLRDVTTLLVCGGTAVMAAGALTRRLLHSSVLETAAWAAGMAAVLVILALLLFNLSRTAQWLYSRFVQRGLRPAAVSVPGESI